jgi:hypothetical protein
MDTNMQTQQAPSQPVQPAPPVSSPPHRSKTPLLILGAIVLLLLGLTGGYLLKGSTTTADSQLAQISPTIPEAQPTATPTIPATANQKVSPPAEIETEVTASQLKSIPVVSTADWETETLNSVSFKRPPDMELKTFAESPESGILVREDGLPYINIRVKDYNGGSRRKEYFGDDYYDCHYIYEEAMFGTVKALQIAADNGWCQGGAGAIVTVVGDKLVSIGYLAYYPDTKAILRSAPKDTLISTLSTK